MIAHFNYLSIWLKIKTKHLKRITKIKMEFIDNNDNADPPPILNRLRVSELFSSGEPSKLDRNPSIIVKPLASIELEQQEFSQTLDIFNCS